MTRIASRPHRYCCDCAARPRTAPSNASAADVSPKGDPPKGTITGVVHRLFDEGLVSARWAGAALELVRSPRLEPEMVEAPERGTVIRIETGNALILPADRSQWPSTEQIRFHQRNVFKGPESLVS